MSTTTHERREARRRALWIISLCLVVVCALFSLSAMAAVATAQETATQTPENSSSETELRDQLGKLQIHEVRWFPESNRMSMTVSWQGSTPTTVSSIQMIDPDSSSEKLGIDQTRIRPETKTNLTVSLTEMDPVVVSTPESIERGEATVLSHNPQSGESVRVLFGVLLGIAVGGAGTVGAVWRRYKSTNSVERTTDSGGLL
jgi:hypothetical protein